MSYYWLDEHGNRHNNLPRIWKGITPFNELRATELGWTQIEQLDPIPELPDTTERDKAEKAIVKVIVDLAQRYDALNELARLEDVSIPTLLEVATRYGVTAADLQGAETSILILARPLEAVTGGTWGEAWDGLKSRFAGYLEQLLEQTGGQNE